MWVLQGSFRIPGQSNRDPAIRLVYLCRGPCCYDLGQDLGAAWTSCCKRVSQCFNAGLVNEDRYVHMTDRMGQKRGVGTGVEVRDAKQGRLDPYLRDWYCIARVVN